MIPLANYPQLRLIAWNRRENDFIEKQEALEFYEANWRFVELDHMSDSEHALLQFLVQKHGNGVLNV